MAAKRTSSKQAAAAKPPVNKPAPAENWPLRVTTTRSSTLTRLTPAIDVSGVRGALISLAGMPPEPAGSCSPCIPQKESGTSASLPRLTDEPD